MSDSIKKALATPKIADHMQFALKDENELSFNDKGIVASLLNNLKHVNDSLQKVKDDCCGGSYVDTTSSDFGPYMAKAMPLITAWYPNFPLKDLVVVETTDQPLGWLFFSKLKANKTKAGQVKGNEVETPLGLRTIKGIYPTGEVFGEEIAYNTSGYATGYAPFKVASATPDWLTKFKVTLVKSGTSVVFDQVSVSGTTMTFGKSGSAEVVTIDTTTGAITASGSSAPAASGDKIVVNYVWDIDYADCENIQSVKEEIERLAIEVQPRVLSEEWTVFAEYLKKTQFGQDIKTDNTERMLNLLYQFQVRYVLDDLFERQTGYADYNTAKGSYPSITLPTGSAISLDVMASNVSRELKKFANFIELQSGRIEGNRIVCGLKLKSFLESLPSTWFTPTPDANTGKYGFSGPREIGTFGTFKVYYDNQLADGDNLMTYRGSEWYDGAYYMLEYMPVVPSEAVQMGVTVRQSFCSMESYYFHKKNCVMKFTVA